MLFIRDCALLLAFTIMGANVFATQPAQISVWPVDSLTKVFPNDSPGTHLVTLDFWAARGQHVSIQFAIRSRKALKNMSVDALIMSGPRDEGKIIGDVRPSKLPPGRGILVSRTHGQEMVQIANLPPL